MKEGIIYWYDVTIKLPDEGRKCLVLNEGIVSFSEYSHGNFKEPYFGQDIRSNYENVTYWAYLPGSPIKE